MVGATPDDLAKFARDKTGRLPVPLPGTEDVPESERLWSKMHTIMHTYLAQTHHTNALAATYQRFFSEQLERFPLGEWREATVMGDVMKQAMAEAAVVSLLGKNVFDAVPDVLRLFWEADKVLGTVLYGPPRWAFPDVYAKMDAYHEAMGRVYQDAWAKFDWDGPDKDADWEPIFGSRFFRELCQWMKRSEFSPRTCAGLTGVQGIVA